jgi:ubiquinone/menaquinone biosynthesis C-methylase UbiE
VSSSPAVPADDAPISIRPGVNDRYFEPDVLDQWVDRFERERREVVANRDEILDALRLEDGMRVADVGAGTGLFSAGLSRGVGETGRVYATDIVPAFLERLRERARQEDLGNLEVVEASPTDPKLPTGALDLVFMCDVYHHVEYPLEYMRALRATLHPEGRLVLVDFERIEGKTHPRMLKHIRASKEEVLDELTTFGFQLVEELDLGLEENYVLVLERAD